MKIVYKMLLQGLTCVLSSSLTFLHMLIFRISTSHLYGRYQNNQNEVQHVHPPAPSIHPQPAPPPLPGLPLSWKPSKTGINVYGHYKQHGFDGLKIVVENIRMLFNLCLDGLSYGD